MMPPFGTSSPTSPTTGCNNRSEVAMLLTGHGYSPGDIDMVFWLEERVGSVSVAVHVQKYARPEGGM